MIQPTISGIEVATENGREYRVDIAMVSGARHHAIGLSDLERIAETPNQWLDTEGGNKIRGCQIRDAEQNENRD